MNKQIMSLILALCIICIACAPAMASSEDSSAGDAAEETVNPETVFQPVIDEFSEVITLGSDALEQLDAFTYVSDLGVGGYVPGNGTVYAFHDINDDGVPEMIVGMGADCGKRNILEVLYYEEGKIGELFNHAFFYRSGLHIGADGTVMQEGSVSAFCETMTIYSVKDSLSMPSQLESYYYDSSDNKMFTYMQEDGHSELSQADYYKAVNDFIMNGLDYSSLDWSFFVVPPEGEYDPYPKENAVSGIYRENIDWVLKQGMSVGGYNQFIFDDDEGTFEFSFNLPDGWATVSGSYTETDSGYIDCSIEKRSFGYDYGHGNITDIYLQRDGDSLYLVSDYWTSEYYRDRGQMFFDYYNSFSMTPDSGSAFVTGDGVRIRSGPGTDYTILFALNKGATVYVTGKTDGWYRIEYSDGGYTMVGYMSADYIAKK